MASITASKTDLAINGGDPIVKNVEFKPWPPISKLDEEYVLASLRQPSHASGPNAKALMQEFAEWNGNKFCCATSAGTAALHMCLAACDVEAGDEVITTALSWTSSATCILHQNAIPIFIDVDWASMHLDPKKIEDAITPNTKAILVVHYWGVSVDMAPIMKIAKKHDLKVIEDACQAHGALYKGKKVGTIGHAGAFSLNQNKNLCGGEGGFFVTDDETRFKKGMRLIAFSEFRPPEAGREYDPNGMGYMYRTSDLPAAFARAQLKRLDKNNAAAQKNWARIHDGLEGLPHLVRSFTSKTRPTTGYAYVLRTEAKYAESRGVSMRDLTDAIGKAISAEGIQARPARWVLPAHTVFQVKNGYGKGSPWSDGHARKDVSYDMSQYPVAQACADASIWIGVNMHRPPNGAKQCDAVVKAVRKVYNNLDDVPVTASK